MIREIIIFQFEFRHHELNNCKGLNLNCLFVTQAWELAGLHLQMDIIFVRTNNFKMFRKKNNEQWPLKVDFLQVLERLFFLKKTVSLS